MHLVARRQLLAQQADGNLGNGERVLGVDAFPRSSRRMGLVSLEVDVEVRDGAVALAWTAIDAATDPVLRDRLLGR